MHCSPHVLTYLLPCVRMRSSVMCLVASICVRTYVRICMSTKKWLFSALWLENFLLSVICCLLFEFNHLQCGLLCPVSCTDRAIHAFPNNTLRPHLGPKMFSSEL